MISVTFSLHKCLLKALALEIKINVKKIQQEPHENTGSLAAITISQASFHRNELYVYTVYQDMSSVSSHLKHTFVFVHS